MSEVTLRNTINNERMTLDTTSMRGRTVRDAVRESGFVAGEFSVRDKQGRVVDESPIDNFHNTVVNVGLPGDSVVGG